MKRRIPYIATVLCAACLVSSCSDWLEAVSTTQVEAYRLFEEKSGYYDALNGIYLNMGETSVYGRDMTMYCPDLMTYPTENVDQQAINTWQILDTKSTTAKSTILSMWKGCYNVIANINLALQQLEEHRSLFSEELEYNLIRGELLGLRAYIHFDLLRFFGLAHADLPENASKVTVPYVTEYSKVAASQKTYAQTFELLEKDLKEALTCLENDPVTGYRSETFENAANSEGYWDNRAKHMNYYAALALAARIYQWHGDLETAAGYASEAASGAFASGAVSWYAYKKYLSEKEYSAKDMTMSSEHLFSLEVSGLYNSSDYFMKDGASIGLRLGTSFVDDTLYPSLDIYGSLAGAEDVRGPLQGLEYTKAGYNCYKLYGSETMWQSYRNRMPMLKVSEMYYIMAEERLAAQDTTGAFALLDEVRSHRGVQESLSHESDAFTELTKEYCREFYNEGQFFHWMKHTDNRCNLCPTYRKLSEAVMVLPYPDEETNYGRNQEL